MKKFHLYLVIITILFSTIHFFTTAEQPQQLRHLHSTLESTRAIAPNEWSKVLSLLLSYQQVSIADKFGPYGEHRDDKDYLTKIYNDVPEIQQIYNTPIIYNFHNFMHEVNIPTDLFTNVQITQVSSNIPFHKITNLIQEQQKALPPSTTLPSPENWPRTTFIPNDPNVEQLYTTQHSVYNFLSLLFPSSPYIRLELTSTDPHATELVRIWLESYSETNNVEHIMMKFSTFPRTVGGYSNIPRQYQTILYIEPDILVHYGQHFTRLSQHGSHAGFLMLMIFILIIGSQLGFQYWQQTHQSTYDQFIVLCLWLVPLGVALLGHFKRFIIIWWCYTCVTALVLSLLFIDLNPIINKFLHALDALVDEPMNQNGQTGQNGTNNGQNGPNGTNNTQQQQQQQQKLQYIIPQRYIFSIVYKYFLLIHKLIMVLLTISLIVFFADIFGIFQALGLEPHMVGEMYKGHEATAEEVLTFVMFALYGLFYSIYFGVLNRDIATIVIPQLTLLSTKYKISIKKDKKDNESDNDTKKNHDEQSLLNTNQIETSRLGTNYDPTKQRINHNHLGQQIHLEGDDHNEHNNDTWNKVGSILSDNTSNNNTNDVESFFTSVDNNIEQQQYEKLKKLENDKKVAKIAATRNNSCGICHELLKSQQQTNMNDITNGIIPNNNTTTDLPTISEIRSRLKRQPMNIGSLHNDNNTNKISTTLTTLYKYTVSMLFTLISTLIFSFIDLCDYCTGGTGQVNIDNVTIIEGMYTINASPTTTTSSTTTNNNNNNSTNPNTIAPTSIRHQNQFTSSQTTAFDDDDYNDDGSSLIHSSNGFAMNQAHSEQHENTIQTQDDVVFELPCHCKVHDICLRGFMLLGKHNICPSCKEISSFDVFVSPWDSIYDNYKQFLETVKYFIAINPLLLFIINIMLYFFW